MTGETIAFIGGGNMARAIAGGLIDSGMDASRLRVSEPSDDAREMLEACLPGAYVHTDNNAVAAAADTLVLAVKPQVLASVCRELRATVQQKRPLIVSIAAGVRASDIDVWLGGGLAIVRVMPNQPALKRRGVAGLFANAHTSDAECARATRIMEAVGAVVEVDNEPEIDAVTAVSGSGPAYFFLLIDVLIKTAVELGIDAAAARVLAIETARGAAELANSEDIGMDELIARVRSPGGTTAAALDRLDAANVRAIFADAIMAANNRAAELADAAHGNDDNTGPGKR